MRKPQATTGSCTRGPRGQLPFLTAFPSGFFGFFAFSIFLTAFLTGFHANALAYVAHEWGTFTTLVDSRGQRLSGLYLENESLPFFVDSLPFYYPPHGQGRPSPEILAGVTTKMETPLVYFYSDSGFHADIDIGFSGGAITQWYPPRDSGDADPAEGRIDFQDPGKPHQGHIHWKLQVLPRQTTTPLTHAQANGDWLSARQPPANLVKSSQGDVEKFLFYRGLGHVELPLGLTMPHQDTLVLRNHFAGSLPYVLVLDLMPKPADDSGQEAKTGVWWEGSLQAGQNLRLTRPTGNLRSGSEAALSMKDALVRAGLSDIEATNMLFKWHYNYFVLPGFKVFWILPRGLTDAILPMHLNPAPDTLERVIVGRSEILTPGYEAELIRAQSEDSLALKYRDHFYLAYLDYLSRWQGQGSALRPVVFPRARHPGRLRQGHLPWADLLGRRPALTPQ